MAFRLLGLGLGFWPSVLGFRVRGCLIVRRVGFRVWGVQGLTRGSGFRGSRGVGL